MNTSNYETDLGYQMSNVVKIEQIQVIKSKKNIHSKNF